MLLYDEPTMTIRDFTRSALPILCASLLALSALSPARALENVALGEVAVAASGEQAIVEAMRIVLVRMTGKRDAASDPAVAALLRDARRYVQVLRPAGADDFTRVTLDAEAIQRALVQAGQPVWLASRPIVLGVVLSAPPSADPEVVRSALETAADRRGLPLRLQSAAGLGLDRQISLSDESARALARRVGADAVLLGERDGSDWLWTLFDGVSTTSFPGSATAGVEGAADLLALASQAISSQPLGETRIRISGVHSLADFVAVQSLLQSLRGVGDPAVLELDGSAVSFRLMAPGGASGLAELLARESRLQREAQAPEARDTLGYRWGR